MTFCYPYNDRRIEENGNDQNDDGGNKIILDYVGRGLSDITYSFHDNEDAFLLELKSLRLLSSRHILQLQSVTVFT